MDDWRKRYRGMTREQITRESKERTRTVELMLEDGFGYAEIAKTLETTPNAIQLAASKIRRRVA